MASHFKFFALAAIAISSFAVVQAQVAPAPEQPAGDVSSLPSLPYIAEVIGEDVYIRAGAGLAYYETGKINKPARVTVVGHLLGWSKIIPPVGSFSWVAKDYVELSPDTPGVGIIKGGDGVRVWAGSDYCEPLKSYQQQVQLNDGDMVKLIDPEAQKSDYYKIVPPPGAYLWISSLFLKYIQPLPKPVLPSGVLPKTAQVPPKPEPKDQPKVNVVIKPDPGAEPGAAPKTTVSVTPGAEPKTTVGLTPGAEPKTTVGLTPGPTPTAIDPGTTQGANPGGKPEVTVEVSVAGEEARRLKEFYDLNAKINLELEKPLIDQNYDEFKSTLTAILNDPDAGKAKRYAEYQMQQIARFELAQQSLRDVTQQDTELQKIRQQIRRQLSEQLAQVPNPGKYIVKGTLQPSLVFTGRIGKKRYKILNDEGRILCYAVSADGVIGIYADQYIGRKVGLKGNIVSDPANPIGLVTFTAIEEVPAEKMETANNTK